MTSSAVQHSTGSEARSSVAPYALITILAGIALAAFGTFADGSAGAEHSVSEFLIGAGFVVVAGGVVFGFVVPRYLGRPSAAGVGLGLCIAAAVFLAAFWSGLPLLLGVGGVMLGQAARARGRGGLATAAIVLGTLVLVADVVLYVADWMSTNNIAGL